MSDKIEPALSEREWANVSRVLIEHPLDIRSPDGVRRDLAGTGYYEQIGHDAGANAEMIAMNNAALPDDDPRKITRGDVSLLREAVEAWDAEQMDAADSMDTSPWFSDERRAKRDRLRALTDALESYLPPPMGPR